MNLNLVMSHFVAISLFEIAITAFLIFILRDYKTHKNKNADECQESETMAGGMIMLQLFGVMVMTLDIFAPSLTHFMAHQGFVGAIIFVPIILLSAFLSARIITPRIFRL